MIKKFFVPTLILLAVSGSVHAEITSNWNNLSSETQECLSSLGFGPEDELVSNIAPEYFCDPLSDPGIKKFFKRYPNAKIMHAFSGDGPLLARTQTPTDLDFALILRQVRERGETVDGFTRVETLGPLFVQWGYTRALSQYVAIPNADVNGGYPRALEVALNPARLLTPRIRRQMVATLLQRSDIEITDTARQYAVATQLTDLIEEHQTARANTRPVVPGLFQLLRMPGALEAIARRTATPAGGVSLLSTSGNPVGPIPPRGQYELRPPLSNFPVSLDRPVTSLPQQRPNAQLPPASSSGWGYVASFGAGAVAAFGLHQIFSTEQKTFDMLIDIIKRLQQENAELKKKQRV